MRCWSRSTVISNPTSMSFLAVVGVSAERRSNSFFSHRSQSCWTIFCDGRRADLVFTGAIGMIYRMTRPSRLCHRNCQNGQLGFMIHELERVQLIPWPELVQKNTGRVPASPWFIECQAPWQPPSAVPGHAPKNFAGQ